MSASDSSGGETGVFVTPHLTIPHSELQLQAISGSGPGGQHVNRSATRISLTWNVRESRALDEMQRTRVLGVLGSRVDSEGLIRIVAGEYRSQMQNRAAAMERLAQLIARALVVPKSRKATKPTRASVERRIDEKKQRARTKRERNHRED